jgi:hypothetical protein
MAQHGAIDQTNNAPIWVTAQVNKSVNTANRDALYNNNTPDSFVTGERVGVFGVAANQMANTFGSIPHTGWILRKIGTGGRAGRVQQECLVAGGFNTDTHGDVSLYITTQPINNTAADPAPATFRVVANAYPANTVTYQWQRWGGASFADISANSIYTLVTTAAMVISDVTGLNGEIYRVRVMTGSAANVFSSNAVLTVT